MKRINNHLRIILVGWLAVVLVGQLGCRTLRKKSAIDADTLAARQLVQQGDEAAGRGIWSDAEQRFQEAIQFCPDNEEARWKYADCLWRRGESREAIKQMEEVVQHGGHHDVEKLVRLGTMLHDSRDLQTAEQYARQAIQLDHQSATAWKLLGDVARASNDPSAALNHYQRAITYAPHDPQYRYALAEVYQLLRRPHRTLATLDGIEQSYEQIPAEVHFLQGLAYGQLQRYDDAATALLAAAEKGKKAPFEVWESLAASQLASGQFEAAQRAANQALDSANPDQRQRSEQLLQQIADLRSSQSPRRL
ncbi:MAG: tetratricopeptide repeat protein [Planctomycetales bacterium]|nr:tetratricopeptide repeat protein [Planctomycetales bacterium]